MFKLGPNPQAQAAPLQSYVKTHGVSVQPNAMTSMKSPMVPKENQNMGGWKSPFASPGKVPFLEPMFVKLLDKYFGG